MARKNTNDTFNAWCNRRPFKGGGAAVWTDGETIFSYSTPIVERTATGIKFNATRYSTTTSCQQNGLRWLMDCKGLVAQEWTVDNS